MIGRLSAKTQPMKQNPKRSAKPITSSKEDVPSIEEALETQRKELILMQQEIALAKLRKEIEEILRNNDSE